VLGDIAKLGGTSLIQILVDMAIAGSIILIVAPAFGLSGKLGSLLAVGTSICGVSAIVAAKGAIRAVGGFCGGQHRRNDCHRLFVFQPCRQDRRAGQVDPQRADRLCRPGLRAVWAARGQADEITPGAAAKAAFSWEKFPKFVLGFLAVSAIATAGWLSKGQAANLANVSKWAFLLIFAGVGLTTDIRQIARTGWRPLVVAIILLTVVASVSLGIVLLTLRGFHWGLGT
jgi:uncharacterized membrane protein YadS